VVIGSGMMASCFAAKGYDAHRGVVVFASGVSHSKSNDSTQFQRERTLLASQIAQHQDSMLLYFSTCSVDDPSERNSAYCQHKLAMEKLIQDKARRFLIARVSQVVGRGGNPATLVNFLLHAISNGIPFELWMHAERNLIGLDELFAVVHHIFTHQDLTNRFSNSILNIAQPNNTPVSALVAAIEAFTGNHALAQPCAAGSTYTIDTSAVQPVYEELGLQFPPTYLNQLLERYFPEYRKQTKAV
jgi:nucleoside-diphosphate-sugar epimerase